MSGNGFYTNGNGAPRAAGGLIRETTTANFQADVMAESRNQPVLVDFWAPWCEPCKQLTPVLEKIVREAGGAVKLVKMNIDDHPTIAGQMGIRSIPAVVAFIDGRPVDAMMGAVPESDIKAFIGRLSGGQEKQAIADMLAGVAELVQKGDYMTASRVYAQILQDDPKNIAAIAGFATCLLETGETDKAKAILAGAPADEKNDPALKAVQTRIELLEQAEGLGDPAALEKRALDNPQDYQARFDLALVYNARGKRAEAADMLLAILKADRDWNDGVARRQLLQFFDAWGARDEATLNARRKLSTLLFS
ncbi:MAG: Thioredoxin (precursor) [Candidatus Tokpelaia hoelldobleri]|uniref:Thioredoxin n=1 Tax=Candidatus Tokpelaia hoelldobleri TaxID=1902579 RepID=A0A1U9JT59_9HYPH|nr:MAG: Thioredoxin (precursor) [Candidatus Tokpelaia hoelldoblerii]